MLYLFICLFFSLFISLITPNGERKNTQQFHMQENEHSNRCPSSTKNTNVNETDTERVANRREWDFPQEHTKKQNSLRPLMYDCIARAVIKQYFWAFAATSQHTPYVNVFHH